MNTWSNGTLKVGAPGSYQHILSGFEDCLKGKPKDYEVYHIGVKLAEEGLKIGLTKERINKDWQEVHAKIMGQL